MRAWLVILGVAGCEGPDATAVGAGEGAERAVPPSLAEPRLEAPPRAAPPDGISICRVTSDTADGESVMQAYVMNGWPVSATLARDGVETGAVIRWTTVRDGSETRVQRRAGRLEGGALQVTHDSTYEYVDGQLFRYTHGDIRATYRPDGRPIRVTAGDGRDERWFYDDAGRITERWRSTIETEPKRWRWEWDGDRLVSSTAIGSAAYTTWLAHDEEGLPAFGDSWWIDSPTGERRSETDIWTWEDGHPTSHRHLDRDGAEEFRRDWTWDGPRLLTSATNGILEERWTWDAEGRAVAWEKLDDTPSPPHRTTWAWDGDRLISQEHEMGDVWWSITWSASCPPRAWIDSVPQPWVETPVSGPRPEALPNGW